MNQKTFMEASYIVAFFQNVGSLNSYYAQYQDLMLELKYKYNSKDFENFKKANLNDEDKNLIREEVRVFRIISTQVYMQYESFKKHAKVDATEDKTIQEKYMEISTSYILDAQSMKDFVLKLNMFLTNDVIADLFDKSTDILNIKNG